MRHSLTKKYPKAYITNATAITIIPFIISIFNNDTKPKDPNAVSRQAKNKRKSKHCSLDLHSESNFRLQNPPEAWEMTLAKIDILYREHLKENGLLSDKQPCIDDLIGF